MSDESNGVRLDDDTSLRGFWAAHTAAGGLALGAAVFLVVLRHVFRNHLGG